MAVPEGRQQKCFRCFTVSAQLQLIFTVRTFSSTYMYVMYVMKFSLSIRELNSYTAISRKVVGKNVNATIPKGNMGYDQYTVPDDCSCRTYFCCFPLALANTFPWPFVPILSNFFSKRELKTTHNAFKDCRVHFSRQPFSKQLYLEPIVHVICMGLMVLEST